uniref:Ig-like domain-containing protein n=1 Tax=Sciurus vulgaris TaxID=55149 RepID=A0A8D2AQF4_SCIVU
MYPGLPILLCINLAFLCPASSNIQRADQPTDVHKQGGESLTIDCKFTVSFSYYNRYWYQQPSSGKMIYMTHLYSENENKKDGQYSMVFQKSLKILTLTISALAPRDRAMYFCTVANSTGGSEKLIFGKGTELTVNPSIKDPDPTVYQLRDSKFRNTSVCLFTDFESPINETQGTKDSEVFISKNPVLDMRSMDSKSNGALAWSNKIDFTCRSAFTENASFPSPEVPCNAKLIEESFETDMNLNFQNLSVMGLRILLLKVAGFNLLLTLRLWSS